MAILQDKTQETLMRTAHTCAHQKYTDTQEAVTHTHTPYHLSISQPGRGLVFLVSLSVQGFTVPLRGTVNAAPLSRNPEILKNTAIHQMQKKLSGAPAVSMKPADQVNPGETSDPLLRAPNKSPSAVKNLGGLRQFIHIHGLCQNRCDSVSQSPKLPGAINIRGFMLVTFLGTLSSASGGTMGQCKASERQ